MGVYFGTTEITNVDWIPGDKDITQAFFGSTEVFTVWAEYDSTLPAQYSANGSTLADYRIYGASGGVGDNSGTAYGYEVDMSVQSGNLFNAQLEQGSFIPSSGAEYANNNRVRSNFEDDVIPAGTYTINAAGAERVGVYVYDTAKNYVRAQSVTEWKRLPFTFTINNAYYVRFIFSYVNDNAITPTDVYDIMLNAGLTALPYQPYSKTVTSIYLGSDPLGDDEYIDYKSGKIYRKTDNLIPVPEVRKLTDGELTVEVTDEGEWRYTVSNATQESRECIFDVTPFTFPQGTSWGGDGVFKLWYGNGSLRIGIIFLGDDGSEDIWIPEGSGDNIYHALAYDGEFLCTKIKIMAAYGQAPISGFLKPMLVNTGIDPQTFVSHVAPEDPPVPLPALPTVDGTNIVDYAGQSAAVPSRFYAKYRKEGF